MKTVLHLTPAGSQLWRKGPAGWQAHDGASSGPVWVLTDLAEEGFADLQVPRIFGRDRQAFVARQLASRFPDTPYRTVLPAARGGSLMDRIAPPRLGLLGLDAAQRVDAALATLTSPLTGVWTTSMLLAGIGCRKGLPPELFVVLPAPEALRIVVIKNREPVLSRLVAGVTKPADQVAEIVRTLRHLENTRVLERGTHRHGVLILGGADDMAAQLAQDHLELLPWPPPWATSAPPDWRFALFDLAVTTPPGQLAPLSRRVEHVASQWRRAAYGAAALCAALSVWAAFDNVRNILASESARAQAQTEVQRLASAQNEAEQKMVGFGVGAEAVRRAVTLEREELTSAPPLKASLLQLARAIAPHEAARLGQLSWRLLPAGRAPCVGGAPGAAAAAEAAPTGEPTAPTRRLELSFDLTPPQDQAATARAQMVASVSAALAKGDGVSLHRDPARELPQATLSGGASSSDRDKPLSWCLSLPAASVATPGAPTLTSPSGKPP